MPALNTFVQAGNIRCHCIRRASVFNNIVRDGRRCWRVAGGKNMFSMFAADLIAQHGAFDLRLFRHIDDQYAIGRPDRRFRPAKVRPRGDKGGGGLHLAARFLLNQRVQQRIEPCFSST